MIFSAEAFSESLRQWFVRGIMGIASSCHRDSRADLLRAIGEGDLHLVKLLLHHKPKLVNVALHYRAFSPLHYAASLGQLDVVSFLLETGASVETLNKEKQTPLMLACKNGRVSCAELLIQRGANILIFDAGHQRTCMHYAAKSGHLHCLQIIMAAAKTPSVSQTWGFARFLNIRDGTGATPLHLAARSCHLAIVRVLLTNGALVSATTTRSRRNSLVYGSTPLHFAARGGSTECVKELLAWGADRLQRNSQGYTPFFIAMKYRNMACAALLNPMTAEPLVWPSPWNFMSNLDPEAKLLLEDALVQANDAWEKKIFSSEIHKEDDGSASHEIDENEEDMELCAICFERSCTIEFRNCGHQMCASCTLALCCHNRPNPVTVQCSLVLLCPFCRCNIEQLRRAQRVMEGEEQEDGCEKDDERKEGEDEEGNNNAVVDRGQAWKPVTTATTTTDGGSSSGGGFMGLVSKGSFRLISSAWGSSRVMDMDWQKASIDSEHTISLP